MEAEPSWYQGLWEKGGEWRATHLLEVAGQRSRVMAVDGGSGEELFLFTKEEWQERRTAAFTYHPGSGLVLSKGGLHDDWYLSSLSEYEEDEAVDW